MKNISVRLPRLLDRDMREIDRLRPRAQGIEITMTPLSTASLELEEGSGVGVRAFVELFTAKGSAGIYRVTSPEENIGSGERIRLEHGICVLDDAIIPGAGRISGTPREVFAKILGYQTAKAQGKKLWSLGEVEIPEDNQIIVDHNGTKTLEMLMRAVSYVPGYMLKFDQSSMPWILHVRKKPNAAACEGRLTRNIRTLRKVIDDNELCTRLYCNALDEGYIESDTVEAWGIVEKSVTVNADLSKDEVLRQCTEYLESRKNPSVSIEVEADEWYALTGEPLDRFEVGDICRLALPEYGATVEERIVSIRYKEALASPEAVSVTLASEIVDMSVKMAQAEAQTAAQGNMIRVVETKVKNLEDSAEGFEDTADGIMHWMSVVGIDLNAEETFVGIFAQRTEVTENSKKIKEALLILNGDTETGGVQAGLVAKVGAAEAAIIAKVDKSGIAAALNNNEQTDGESSVLISADKVDLGKYATVGELNAERAKIDNLTSGVTKATILSAANITADGANIGSMSYDKEYAVWKTHKQLVGGTIKSGYNASYNVYGNDGSIIGKVNVPADYTFAPSYAEDDVKYIGAK